ncbi:hypothetical protein I546_3393 [Mycobacterium kansasii 732]|nr:hypothetical protein I546_3393 [Mycobacterium kansasii 732]
MSCSQLAEMRGVLSRPMSAPNHQDRAVGIAQNRMAIGGSQFRELLGVGLADNLTSVI